MKNMTLPPRRNATEEEAFPRSRQVSIVGANGSGKSRFISRLIRQCGDKAYVLSALNATFPERRVSTSEGSIDMLYAHAVRDNAYLKTDSVSELDKLCYLLFSEEFRELLSAKAAWYDASIAGREKPAERLKPTKLDKVVELWERIFPGNKLLRHAGKWMFTTDAGDDVIPADTLSRGEKAVLYYVAAVLYAPRDAVVFIEQPSLFLHPSILNMLWNSIEGLREDCTFIYNTVDMDFITSRTENSCIWVKSYDVDTKTWEYEAFGAGRLPDDLYITLIGSRRPVLFIEGDLSHSIDMKLYTLLFDEYMVKPLGGCNKVIESVRTFNDLRGMHHLDSHGIVDRDRRTVKEVEYLRHKGILVPEVAEVENLFLLEGVIKGMAEYTHRNGERIFSKVKGNVVALFKEHYRMQALQHVRHKMKRDVEFRIDARFTCITALETHIKTLVNKLRPRDNYNQLIKEFEGMISGGDYAGILRVFNHKPMLGESRVAEYLGFSSKEAYITGVIQLLKRRESPLSIAMKECLRGAFQM